MTETEWLTCAEPAPMLEFLRDKASDRKLRLFVVACCRENWHLFIAEDIRRAVAVAEWDVDGLTNKEVFGIALRGVSHEQQRIMRGPPPVIAAVRAAWVALTGGRGMTSTIKATVPVQMTTLANAIDLLAFVSPTPDKVRRGHASVLHDIFGNPFRPLPPRSEAIAPLAEQIYAGQWDQMPLLGKWLHEHGYWSEGEHCLDPNIHHIKGCWVVDWVTGRE